MVLSVSIRACGIVSPALRYRGVVIDGARRVSLCRLMGKVCPVLDVRDTTQAARLLYRAHPERAWVVFVQRGMPRRVIADLFGLQLRELPVAQTMRTRARRRR
jgi:ParB-like chromosome segregation protein Spo0J